MQNALHPRLTICQEKVEVDSSASKHLYKKSRGRLIHEADYIKAKIYNEQLSSHHHHVVTPSRISLTLTRHFSLSFIASGKSLELHPVFSHSCCMYVRAGPPASARPYRITLLMSSSLLLQQCSACLVCLIWIVFVMGGRWPNSWCLVGCCFQDLFNIARR